ncbi:hypothetical protein ACFYSF_31725 [Streptomyces canus]|uniref:hypothetical protein n=1 Tax=Streptomyces canus TaxID=58343 RepID=UPI0036748DD3
MGSVRLTLCTAVLAVAALTPAAQAADGGSVSVTPSSPTTPGADLTLRVTGCAGRTATAASAAFVADARLTGADGSLTGDTRVRSSVEPGSYDVQVTCADFQVKGRITVAAAMGAGATATATATALATPAAPVNAGGGWTATHLSAMEPHPTGPGTGHAVTGLVLAGVAAVAVVLRRSRRSRGTG